MEIEAKDPSYELGEKATYVTVNGVKHAIVRADTWFDQIGTENAPAPGGKALLLPLGHVIKGSGKFYGVKTVKLALNPDHPAYHAAVHRATYYPADQVTFTAGSRNKLHLAVRRIAKLIVSGAARSVWAVCVPSHTADGARVESQLPGRGTSGTRPAFL